MAAQPSLPRTALLIAIAVAAAGGCVAEDGGGAEARNEAQPALQQLPSLERVTRGPFQRPAFIAGELGHDLEVVSEVFNIAESTLILSSTTRDSLGMSVERYAQERNGLAVVGGDLRVTRFADGEIRSATGTAWGAEGDTATAAIRAEQARSTALSITRGATESSSGELVYIATSKGEAPQLAWQFSITGSRDGMPVLDDVFISAVSGALLDRAPHIHSARIRSTYNARGQQNIGTLARSENSAPDGDRDVDQAHDAAGRTYDCLQALFGRDSYDNAGAELVSVANYGIGFQNAYWSGAEMVYGDEFTVRDIGTHELAHAVTEYTGAMVYQNEPGALNEAWSDILAAVCDAHAFGGTRNATWILAEDLPIGAIRYLNDPTLDGISYDFYPERYLGTEDEGGVHLNSGIANLAFYLLTEGGVHPRGKTSGPVVGIGIEAAGDIFYRALTSYMNVNSNFAAARAATELAAEDLFGVDSPQSISVSEAWAAVGVGGAAPERQIEPEPEPEEPGDEPEQPGGDDGTGPAPHKGGTGTVVGSCSTSGSGSASGAWLFLLGLAAAARRRRS